MLYQSGRCCAHGGLLIYIQNGLECTTVTELNISSTGWEYLCVEVCERKPHSKKYTICNVYRTPSDIVKDLSTFREEFSTLLSNMKAMKHACYVCGTYNVDLLKAKTN